ncbi:GPI transamidase component [Agyrium rufum]|nr:GPI transamidase component [Agyrium rufum]
MDPASDDTDSASDRKQAGSVQAAAATLHKEPPPEPQEAIQIRSYVVLSFWAVVILLGLPTWFWTTSIHRAHLPLQEMLNWADGEACKPTFPLQITVDAPAVSYNEAHQVVQAIQYALDDLNEFSAHHLRLVLSNWRNESRQTQTGLQDGEATTTQAIVHADQERLQDSEDVALSLKLLPAEGLSAYQAALVPHSTTMEVLYPASHGTFSSSSTSGLVSNVVKALQEVFAEEQASIAQVLGSHSSSPTKPQLSSTSSIYSANGGRDSRKGSRKTLSPDLEAKLSRRTTRSVKYAPLYHITISLFTPTAKPASWDIDAAVKEYLTPLLESFSISEFTVDTQVQLYVTFSESSQRPEFDETIGKWTLKTEDLSGFINAAEWPLGPSIGTGPTIHFILYAPDEAMSPLVVKENQATSWLIPQWGGIAIINPPISQEAGSATPKHLGKESLRPALMTFSHQLMSLLGAPESPPSFPMQLKTLTRVRAASLLFSASSTMGSLARLTKALPSIAIPETVAASVSKTLLHLQATCDLLRQGKFTAALEHARVAEAEAEEGFFEKSMVGQVYFPDEHKVAVYLPLLGPIGVPLFISGIKELKRLLAILRARRTASH